MYNHRRGSRGFTMIELLVVIAIIAILAAILFPIFTAAREAGKRSACQANMKEMSHATAMYRDVWSGQMPHIWSGGTFWNIMTDYMKQQVRFGREQALRCPSAPWITQTHTSGGAHRCVDGYAYQLNESGWANQLPGTGKSCLAGRLKDSMIMRPSQLISCWSMGWHEYGVAYYNGTDVNNETATDGRDHAGQGGPGWRGYWPHNSDQIPFNGSTAGPRGGTICKIYNLRVDHRGSVNALMYNGNVKSHDIESWQELGSSDYPP